VHRASISDPRYFLAERHLSWLRNNLSIVDSAALFDAAHSKMEIVIEACATTLPVHTTLTLCCPDTRPIADVAYLGAYQYP
jgi:hypothetical protein